MPGITEAAPIAQNGTWEIGREYAEQVASGAIIACEYVKQACQRFLDDLAHAAERGLHFDPDAANHAIRFFDLLRHSKGRQFAGRRFILSPWQVFILANLFGWHRADGSRRFRTAYIELPRKNGKSTLAAGIGLYLEVADGEPGAEVYSAATKKDQAKICHEEAKRMARKSPELSTILIVHRDAVLYRARDSKYEPLGADADSMDGLNPSGLICDELHAWKTRDLFDVLETAVGARVSPLMLCITTAGINLESICGEQRGYTADILAGTVPAESGDSVFGFICTLDEGDDWEDEENWHKANPNLGVSVTREYLREQITQAKHKGPAAINKCRRYYFNIWTGAVIDWIDIYEWDRGGVPKFTEADLQGWQCFGGLDMANKLDIAALALCFPDPDDMDVYRFLWRFWVPREFAVKRERKLRDIVKPWAELGYVTMTDGSSIDYKQIEHDILELSEYFRVEEIAFDPFNAGEMAQELTAEGLKMIEFRQSAENFNPPCRRLEGLLRDGHIYHAGNPVARWMAGNVSIREDARGYIMPSRKLSTHKIDGMTAMLQALARAVLHEDEPAVEMWAL